MLAPGFPRLKEWAYAGIFFNMTGAAVSHAVQGDAVWHVIVTLIFAVFAVVSWALRPLSRRLDPCLQIRRIRINRMLCGNSCTKAYINDGRRKIIPGDLDRDRTI